MAPRQLVAAALLAAVLPSALAQGMALCNKDGKPSPPLNVRIARNEMLDDGKYGEVTVVFNQATANNANLGCATMYRVELIENNQAISKENVQVSNPVQSEVSFARKLNPGKTYKYKITAVNTNTSPARESDSVWTDQFTVASGGGNNGGGNAGWGRPAQCKKGDTPPLPRDFKVSSNGMDNGRVKIVVEWRNPTNAGTGCTTHFRVSWDGNSEFVKLDNPNQENVRWEKALNPGNYIFTVVPADLDHQKFGLPHIQRLKAEPSGGVMPL